MNFGFWILDFGFQTAFIGTRIRSDGANTDFVPKGRTTDLKGFDLGMG